MNMNMRVFCVSLCSLSARVRRGVPCPCVARRWLDVNGSRPIRVIYCVSAALDTCV